MAVGDDVGDLDEGGCLLESSDEEHIGAGALRHQLPRRLAAAREGHRDIVAGRAGDCRLQGQAEFARQSDGVLLLDDDALSGEVLAAAEPEDERPRGQLVGGDVCTFARGKKAGEIGIVDDEDFIAEPEAVNPVGEVDQLLEFGGRGEQVLVGGGRELTPDRRPGHHAHRALRPGEQAEEVGLRRALGVSLHAAGLPLRLQRLGAGAGLAGEHRLAVPPYDAAAAQRLRQMEVVAWDQCRLALQ